MTEAEWLASADPREMVWGLRRLTNLRNRWNRRKLHLFAVACCDRIRHLLEHPDSIRAVDLAEQYADGQVRRAEMLADALMDAGCAEDVIAHCRSEGPHARGCWVVDLCLRNG